MSSLNSYNPLGRQQVPPRQSVVQTFGPFSLGGSLGYEIPYNVNCLFVDTSGTTTLSATLQDPTTVPVGYRVSVHDKGGAAATRNIAITSNGSATIRGTASITTNYGTLEYQTNGVDWFECTGGAGATITGSATQVAVCDGAGGASGDENFQWDGANGIVKIGYGASPPAGASVAIISTVTASFSLSDSYQLTNYSSSGINFYQQTFSVGDIDVNNNGSMVTLNDALQKTTSNVKHETSGDITITDDTKGLVLKSPNGHYWQSAMSNAGALTWTDIGTSPP